MNNITFGATFKPSINGALSSGYSDLRPRRKEISGIFEEKTTNDKTHSLIIDKSRDMGSDEFILSETRKDKNVLVARLRTDFTTDLEKMTNEDAAKRLVAIFNLLKLKAGQNKKVQKIIDAREAMYEKKTEEIRVLKEKQNAQFLAEMKKAGLKTDSPNFPYLAG